MQEWSGKIFAENNILSDRNIFIEAQRSDLIAEYVGQTAIKTKKLINKAKGGVLFIDEAYTLGSYITDEKGRDYGAECIATLIKEMEDNRENLCVILAGYTNEMEHLLKVNSGFRSRIQFKVNFSDYSENELYEIFKKMAREDKYKISSNIKQTLLEYFKTEKTNENFSNGRLVRNIFEKVKFEQAERVTQLQNEDIDLLKKIDVQKAINKNKDNIFLKRTIGF